ncbi:hypothetical protein LIER_19112 [Lithospermum erythrorhizon]|uniref:Uncharacterized protein n=1 Tax=Lithospermum erythrorhizon TaxID=34254 RepID=A0AAV3QLZ0_LITER
MCSLVVVLILGATGEYDYHRGHAGNCLLSIFYRHNHFGCDFPKQPLVDVGMEPIEILDDIRDAKEDAVLDPIVTDVLVHERINVGLVKEEVGADSEPRVDDITVSDSKEGVTGSDEEEEEVLRCSFEVLHSRGVRKLASDLGKFVGVDEETCKPSHPTYAWVLLLIDVRVEPLLEYEISLPGDSSYMQRVEYED